METDKGFFTKEPSQFLFLHGYLSSGSSFINQIKFFDKFGECFAPDLKGFGSNQCMEKAYTLDDYIDQVEEFKYKYSINKPHVIAHSFGGRIALKAAAKDENFCKRLVLAGCAGLKPRFSIKKATKKVTFNFLKTFIPKDKLSVFYSEDYRALSPIMKESFKLIVSEHLDWTLEKIHNPTLIVFGEKDRETPIYMAKKLHKGIKNSQLILLKDAGHFCFVDKPFKFNFKTSEFLFAE